MGYNKYMGEYTIDDTVYQLDREVERAVISRYLEKRFLSVITLMSFIIGFLLGVLAYAL